MNIVRAFIGEKWYRSGDFGFQHGTHVEVKGGYERTGKMKGKKGYVIGLGDKSRFWREGGVIISGYYEYRRDFIVDFGGMSIEIPFDDLELVVEPPKYERD